MLRFVCVIACLAVIAGAQRATTPVPILRQINSHNDDGSYTYGYESADGSYKIETKGANGEVKGKYGYYDPTGMLREIEYGASRNGFGVTGTGIQTPEAAPAANNQITSNNPRDYDDGSYRPGQYDEGHYVPSDEGQYRPEQQQQVQQQQQFAAAPAFRSRVANARQFAQQQQQQYYQPQVQQPYAPVNLPANTFHGHPASNFNLNTGSYSLNY